MYNYFSDTNQWLKKSVGWFLSVSEIPAPIEWSAFIREENRRRWNETSLAGTASRKGWEKRKQTAAERGTGCSYGRYRRLVRTRRTTRRALSRASVSEDVDHSWRSRAKERAQALGTGQIQRLLPPAAPTRTRRHRGENHRWGQSLHLKSVLGFSFVSIITHTHQSSWQGCKHHLLSG